MAVGLVSEGRSRGEKDRVQILNRLSDFCINESTCVHNQSHHPLDSSEQLTLRSHFLRDPQKLSTNELCTTDATVIVSYLQGEGGALGVLCWSTRAESHVAAAFATSRSPHGSAAKRPTFIGTPQPELYAGFLTLSLCRSIAALRSSWPSQSLTGLSFPRWSVCTHAYDKEPSLQRPPGLT